MSERESLFECLRVRLAGWLLPRGYRVTRPVREGEFVDVDARGNDAFGI